MGIYKGQGRIPGNYGRGATGHNNFKKGNFIFLVVEYTKNAADRLFNAIKKEYCHKNMYVLCDLIDTLSVFKNVSVYATKEENLWLGIIFSSSEENFDKHEM